MERIFQTYALCATAVAAVLACTTLRLRLARRRAPWHEALRLRYLRCVVHALLEGYGLPQPAAKRTQVRLLLAETIAGVTAATYGPDTGVLRRIVAAYALDELLLRRIRRSRGYRRAYYLSLLAMLPADGSAARRAERYGRGNRSVRFYALLLRLTNDPSRSIRLIADYPTPLTLFEIGEIVALLRRGALPVAYGPLVASHNRNLRALGLAIVRRFGIEEAEQVLLRIVDREPADELTREALFTLCTLRRPLTRRAVTRRIAAMDRTERRTLLRRMAFEGYAAGALRRVIDAEERPYYEALVASYKRYLPCSVRDF